MPAGANPKHHRSLDRRSNSAQLHGLRDAVSSILLLAGVLSACCPPGYAGAVRRVAGGGAGDGGPATAAVLRSPSRLALDGRGHLFVADEDRVLKINLVPGTVETVYTSNHDRAPASSAHCLNLNSITALAADPAGRLYAAEWNYVCRFDLNGGAPELIAGATYPKTGSPPAPATTVSLFQVCGLALDEMGNIFVADRSGIIRIDLTDDQAYPFIQGDEVGIRRRTEPTMPAGRQSPGDLYVEVSAFGQLADDHSGLMFFVSPSSECLFAAREATGEVLSFPQANEGPIPWGQVPDYRPTEVPEDVSSDKAGNIYLTGGWSIRELDAASWALSNMGFVGPYKVRPGPTAVDADGSIYIADWFDHRIQRSSIEASAGTTIAGTGRVNFAGDGGPATNATIGRPMSLAFDRHGNLLIGDDAGIREVDSSAGIISTIAISTVTGASAPFASFMRELPIGGASSIAVSSKGKVLAAAAGGGIYAVHQAERAVEGVRELGKIALNLPRGTAPDFHVHALSFDRQENLLFAVGNVVATYRPTETRTTVLAGSGCGGFSGDGGPALQACLRDPKGVAEDSLSNLWIADSGNGRIRMVHAETGIITTVLGNDPTSLTCRANPQSSESPKVCAPLNVALDRRERLYIADRRDGLLRWDPRSRILTRIAGRPEIEPLAISGALAIGPDDHPYLGLLTPRWNGGWSDSGAVVEVIPAEP